MYPRLELPFYANISLCFLSHSLLIEGGGLARLTINPKTKPLTPCHWNEKKNLMNPPSFIWKSTYPLPKSVFIFNRNNIVYTVKQSTNACEVHSSVSSFCSAFLSLPRVSLPHPLIFLLLLLRLRRANVKTMEKEIGCNQLYNFLDKFDQHALSGNSQYRGCFLY